MDRRLLQTFTPLHYEYLVIADHSTSARVARGLDLERLEKKIEDLEQLRTMLKGKPIRLLPGVEADTLPDGQSDYPDSILSKFDVITAFVHAAFKQSQD